MKMRTLGLAAAVAALPLAAQAVMLDGQVEIAGGLADLQTIDFQPNGNLDFVDNTADVDFATGDFAFLQGTTATFNMLSFDPDEVVYSGDSGLKFTAQDYLSFDNTSPSWAFKASGIIELAGYDPTPGLFSFTTQQSAPGQVVATFSSSTLTTPIPVPASVLMLFGALGGLAFIGRRRRRA